MYKTGRVKRIWYLSPMRAAKVQASLCIRAVSPEPLPLAHTSSESRGTFRQKARSLAPLNGWACAVKICHDGMLEDTNLLDAPQTMFTLEFCNRIVWKNNKAIKWEGINFCLRGNKKYFIFGPGIICKFCWKFVWTGNIHPTSWA